MYTIYSQGYPYAIIVTEEVQMFVSCGTLEILQNMLYARKLAWKGGKDKKALKIIEPYLKEENPEALYLCAEKYPGLDGLLKGDSAHIEYLEKAADKKYPPALYRLGAYYDVGADYGIKKDQKKAAQMFKEAAELGHAHSQWIYGLDLLYGNNGLEKNEKLGMDWVMKSVQAKSEGAYRTLMEFHEHELFGFSKDTEKIAEYQRKIEEEDVIGC